MTEVNTYIVTRPTNRCSTLLSGLKALSVRMMACPLIEIIPELPCSSLDFRQYDGIIFISVNAVEQAQKQLSAKDWQLLLSRPIFAVGKQTARQLEVARQQAFIGLGLFWENGSASWKNDELSQENREEYRKNKVIYPPSMNTEGLLALPELSKLSGQSWLIVKGHGGRGALKQGLINAGAKITELCVYRRQIPDSARQAIIGMSTQPRMIWLITSVEAMTNLYNVLEGQGKIDCRIIVSSDRIASKAKALGFSVVAQAKNATDEALLEAVQSIK